MSGFSIIASSLNLPASFREPSRRSLSNCFLLTHRRLTQAPASSRTNQNATPLGDNIPNESDRPLQSLFFGNLHVIRKRVPLLGWASICSCDLCDRCSRDSAFLPA